MLLYPLGVIISVPMKRKSLLKVYTSARIESAKTISMNKTEKEKKKIKAVKRIENLVYVIVYRLIKSTG